MNYHDTRFQVKSAAVLKKLKFCPMQGFFRALCLFGLVLVDGALIYPTVREKPKQEDVQMPKISSLDIESAFNYARNQTLKKMEIEKEFFKEDNGHVPSQTKISVGLRMLAPISNSTNEQNLIQQQLEYATSYLEKKYNLTRAQTLIGLPKLLLPKEEPILERCQALLKTNCNETDKYRTLDGSCNNFRYPNWGRASQWYGVMVEQDYGDGMSSPRGSRASCSLPGARDLSSLDRHLNIPSKKFTMMTAAWGQVVAHDVGLVASVTIDGNAVSCCPIDMSAPNPPNCFPIIIPKNDHFYSKLGQDCMDFQRAAGSSYNCKLGTPRRAINQQTSFLDGSIIYGLNKEQTASLRSFKRGGLKYQDTKYGHLLPKSDAPEYDQCSMPNLTCFASGDRRVNSQPSLTSMHLLLARFHDIVAEILANDYPDLTDEILFQEARRIVGAIMQVITYKEFLLSVLGSKLMKFYKLEVLENGFTQYDSEIDPTSTTEFSAGAFRFGHSLVQNTFNEVGKNGKKGQLDLQNNYFYPEYVYKGQMDSLLRGLFYQKSQEFDETFVTGISDHLFEVRGTGYGFDLVAVGIQRGRDTGLPTYTRQLEHFFNVSIQKFEDLSVVMTDGNWKLLKDAYGPGCIKDIDIYLGGFAERHIPGALLGPTFSAVVGYQFQYQKFGDRFYFEHANQPGSFKEGQLKELRRMTMSYLICVASDGIETIPRNVFRITGRRNPLISCDSVKSFGPRFRNWLDK